MKARWQIGISLVFLLLVVVFGLPAVEAVHATKRLMVSQNNLKQIGVGLRGYNAVYETLPLGTDTGADGRPHHGWQVRLLPYLEGGIYIPIDYSYPWNDPFNAPYYRMRWPTWLIPGVRPTTDQDGFAVSHYAGNSHLFGVDRSASLKDLPQGGRQTILAGEVADGFSLWGKPDNWRDPSAGLHGDTTTFGSIHPAGVQFVMADGSVRVIERSIEPGVLKALAASGNEPSSAD
jgi:hypothetical protein